MSTSPEPPQQFPSVVRRARPAGRAARAVMGAVTVAVLGGCAKGPDQSAPADGDALAEALRSGPAELVATPRPPTPASSGGSTTPAPRVPAPSGSVPAEAYPALREDGNAFNAGRRRFARDVLRGLGLPETPQNMVALLAWAVAESGPVETKARNNPLNTAWTGSAVHKVEGESRYNEVGVMHFETYEQGLEATLIKLRNADFYRAITDAFARGDNAMAVAEAVAASPWGTKDGVVRVLSNAKGWPQFQIDPAYRAAAVEGPGR